jgi:hypothetical protein
MSAWLILYLVQTMLAANGGIALHRRLGVVGALVAVAAVATGFVATVAMVWRGFDSSGDLSRPPNNALDATVFNLATLRSFPSSWVQRSRCAADVRYTNALWHLP